MDPIIAFGTNSRVPDLIKAGINDALCISLVRSSCEVVASRDDDWLVDDKVFAVLIAVHQALIAALEQRKTKSPHPVSAPFICENSPCPS
jgi:hypothetical protein